MKMWTRLREAGASALADAITSPRVARASEQMTGPSIAAAISMIACASLGEEAAKPASITSTRSACERFRHAQLAVRSHGEAGRLLPIAQGGVEDSDLGHAELPVSRGAMDT